MGDLSFVTGANGHLGNNLVRRLVAKGEKVVAGVRNVDIKEPFEGVDCRLAYADLLDQSSLDDALNGVDTLYQVAAVFKHWSRNPKEDIIRPNMLGTENILKAAARQNVKKVVYVSSIGALGNNQSCIDETSWNQNSGDPYYYSKTESEKLALGLAKQHNLFLVSVLPAAMIGGHSPDRLTPTMEILDLILKNQQPIDPRFNINFVSIDDVVDGMIAAAEKGRNGERYILGNESPVCTSDIFKMARSISSEVNIPLKPSRPVLMVMALLMELVARITGKRADLSRELIKTYHLDHHTLNLSKSRTELQFHPRDPAQVIQSALEALI